MSRPAPGFVCRGQWSEQETDEEEEEEQASAGSGPREDEESEGGLQINVDEEEPFVLPPAGEMEQDILPEQGLGGCVCEKGFPGLLSPNYAHTQKQFLNGPTCPGSRLAACSQTHPGYSGRAARLWDSTGGGSVPLGIPAAASQGPGHLLLLRRLPAGQAHGPLPSVRGTHSLIPDAVLACPSSSPM